MTDTQERPGHIELKLKWIRTHAESLSERDLDWAIRMEEAFTQTGSLTARQSEVLDDIYRKAK
jgi:hypothetical protein